MNICVMSTFEVPSQFYVLVTVWENVEIMKDLYAGHCWMN